MEKLREEIRIQQINYLRQQARNAQKTKAFEQEAEFWKELLRLSPDDKEASTYLKSCLLNQGREARNRGNWSLEINIQLVLTHSPHPCPKASPRAILYAEILFVIPTLVIALQMRFETLLENVRAGEAAGGGQRR
jgi:hypothetical protein